MWTVIYRGLATKEELETSWTLDDLVRAIDFLIASDDIEKEYTKE